MAFKMKGAPYPISRKGKVNPNSEGNTDLKDGRSASAAFQYSSPVKQTEKKKLMTDTERTAYLKKYNVTQGELSSYLTEQAEKYGDDDIDQSQWMDAVKHLSQGKYVPPGENVDEID